MDVTRALADLEEVRTRLAAAQRFRGLSSGAATASGIAALACGIVQAAAFAHPEGADAARYVWLWSACLAFALAVNYGAILLWLGRNWSVRSRVELKTVGMTILPAIFAGGALTIGLLRHGSPGLLPGMWCSCYALGLFASRTMVAPGVTWVAGAFAAVGAALLMAPAENALAWWVMPATFGFGQLAIGALMLRDEARAGNDAGV